MPEEQVSLDWLQGSVIDNDLLPEELRRPGSIAILASQSCDIVHPSFEIEPIIEFIYAAHVTELDGAYSFGKSPRRLDFSVVRTDTRLSFCCEINDRKILPRNILLDKRPSWSLDAASAHLLSRWLSRRYNRVALPTELVRRIGGEKMTRIRKALKKDGAALSYILVSLNRWDELNVDADYEVLLFGVVPVESLKVPKDIESAARAIAAMRTIVADTAGFVLVDARVVGEDSISLADMRSLRHWEFDSLSLGIDDE